jgi:hypothetical protein
MAASAHALLLSVPVASDAATSSVAEASPRRPRSARPQNGGGNNASAVDKRADAHDAGATYRSSKGLRSQNPRFCVHELRDDCQAHRTSRALIAARTAGRHAGIPPAGNGQPGLTTHNWRFSQLRVERSGKQADKVALGTREFAQISGPSTDRQDTKSKEAKPMASGPCRRMKIGDFLLRRLEEGGIRQRRSPVPYTLRNAHRHPRRVKTRHGLARRLKFGKSANSFKTRLNGCRHHEIVSP